jgi:hypothetical protein
MVVFGLIATLVTVPLAVLVLSGYVPPPESPYEFLFPADDERTVADKGVLVLAAVFSLAFTVVACRLLLDAARRDTRTRKERREGPAQPPPGYQ